MRNLIGGSDNWPIKSRHSGVLKFKNQNCADVVQLFESFLVHPNFQKSMEICKSTSTRGCTATAPDAGRYALQDGRKRVVVCEEGCSGKQCVLCRKKRKLNPVDPKTTLYDVKNKAVTRSKRGGICDSCHSSQFYRRKVCIDK